MADEGEEEAQEEEEIPAAPVQTVVQQPAQELTAPVIDHADRLARIEERQARHEEELGRRLMEVEDRVTTGVNTRLSSIEERLSAALTPPPPPEPVAEIEEEVEVARHKSEDRRGIRGRRKARRER